MAANHLLPHNAGGDVFFSQHPQQLEALLQDQPMVVQATLEGEMTAKDGHQSSPRNSLLKGWEEQIAADPQFTYKVFVEQVYGACCVSLRFCKQPADCGKYAGNWCWSCCPG